MELGAGEAELVQSRVELSAGEAESVQVRQDLRRIHGIFGSSTVFCMQSISFFDNSLTVDSKPPKILLFAPSATYRTWNFAPTFNHLLIFLTPRITWAINADTEGRKLPW